jgi:hypothetical protein
LNNGPISVAVDADQKLFMSYDSGIVGFNCKGNDLDHAILAVGWGQSGTK